MGGGLMQLVAYGAQDVYLTGNPQITFFKVVYRRHTNFSVECIEQTFSGSPGLGKKVSCTISRNGDLISNMWLRFKGDAVTSPPNSAADCTNIVSSVELEIGGQKIDKHYGTWLDIYNELFISNEAHAATSVLSQGDTETHFIPLRFWFNRNPGLALPLIALQYHEVKINVEFNTVYGANGVTDTVSDASLLVNYIYLDTDERRRFAQVSHEYLIEQVQFTGADSLVSGNNKLTLNFNHPVKALIWVAPNLLNAKLQLNGHDRMAQMEADYFHLVQPLDGGLGHGKQLNHTTRVWGARGRAGAGSTSYMYSFCLKPGEHQPSGTCNFSRIDNAVMHMGTNGTGTVNMYAVNYNVLRIMSGMGGLAYSN